jgi:endonuclease/exonuclease/phosphatase (EEP) superfamily protein YafD
LTPPTPAVARLARAWVASCALAASAVALAFHWGALATWWVELLRYLPFLVYLLPAVLAVLVSTLLSWAWRCLALATLGLVLTALMGLEVPRGDVGSGLVRIMTFNAKVHRGPGAAGSLSRIAWEIAQHDPDVLVMQDANFSERSQLPTALRAALGDRMVHLSGQYVVASRLPMRDCRDGEMSYRGESNHYVRCLLSAHGVEFDLVTAHLASPRRGLDATRREGVEGLSEWQANLGNRLIQVGKLVRDLAGNARPMIVAGDLNAPEHSPVLQELLRLGLRDAFSQAGVGFGYTHGHSLRLGFSFLRIDHVLVSETIGVHDCFVGGREASEHRPVIADLLLRRN